MGPVTQKSTLHNYTVSSWDLSHRRAHSTTTQYRHGTCHTEEHTPQLHSIVMGPVTQKSTLHNYTVSSWDLSHRRAHSTTTQYRHGTCHTEEHTPQLHSIIMGPVTQKSTLHNYIVLSWDLSHRRAHSTTTQYHYGTCHTEEHTPQLHSIVMGPVTQKSTLHNYTVLAVRTTDQHGYRKKKGMKARKQTVTENRHEKLHNCPIRSIRRAVGIVWSRKINGITAGSMMNKATHTGRCLAQPVE